MAEKFTSGLKKILYVVLALTMFGPFLFWKGGNKPQQEMIADMADGAYPRRYGGMSMNR